MRGHAHGGVGKGEEGAAVHYAVGVEVVRLDVR